MKIEHNGHTIVLTQKGDVITAKVTNIRVAQEKEIDVVIAKAKSFVDEHLDSVKKEEV